MTGNYLITKGLPEVSEGYCIGIEDASSAIVTLKDSFDYLLLAKGCCLVEKENGSVLFFSADGMTEYKDMEQAALKGAIESIVLPRVLLEKHKLEIITGRLVIRDELEKIIARGEVYTIKAADAEVYAVSVLPLRGYDKEVRKAVLAMTGSNGTFGDAVRVTLEAAGDEMVTYTAKPVIHLTAEEKLHEVMSDIYSHLLHVMSLNTQGIIDDVDIEFLHDFRVSVRRTRSALSLVRGVFAKDIEKEFRGRFRELGSMTGLARDMDVYLDIVDDYKAMLPEWLKVGMDELHDHFVRVREDEYRKLGEYLKSGAFGKLHDDWKKVVTSDKYVSKKGKREVFAVAKAAIYDAFTEIEKQAESMTSETHSDAVHEIRISFKKIRYLLEFYSSLFDKGVIAPMLKDMKALQDSLGDHNDYYVQQLALEELMENREWSTVTASACGFLTAVLAEKQASERVRSLEMIAGFMEYKPLFVELFA